MLPLVRFDDDGALEKVVAVGVQIWKRPEVKRDE